MKHLLHLLHLLPALLFCLLAARCTNEESKRSIFMLDTAERLLRPMPTVPPCYLPASPNPKNWATAILPGGACCAVAPRTTPIPTLSLSINGNGRRSE